MIHRTVKLSDIANSPGLRLDAEYYCRPKVGDTVKYRGCFGRGPQIKAVVTEIGHHNGQNCVALDDGHWCYLHQIDEIVTVTT